MSIGRQWGPASYTQLALPGYTSSVPSRIITLVLSAIPVAFAAGPSPAGTLWAELAAKREGLPGVRQEFQVSRTYRNARGGVQATKVTVILNWAGKQWRELSMSGSGKRILVFDGQDRLSMEEGGDEFVRIKRNSKDGEPAPSPYGSFEPEWAKAIEVERRPCGVTGFSGECAKRHSKNGSAGLGRAMFRACAMARRAFSSTPLPEC